MFNCAAMAAVVLTLVAACGGKGDGGQGTGEGQVAAEGIRVMEDSLYAKAEVDRKGARALQDVYLLYAKQYPLDSLTPEYLFRAAGLRSTLGDPKGSIALYDRIIRDYPGWRKITDTYFVKAFTIDNGLHQRGEAERAYQAVVDKFPEHHLAQEAKMMIQNLKYSDDELIRRFEAMNADSLQASTEK